MRSCRIRFGAGEYIEEILIPINQDSMTPGLLKELLKLYASFFHFLRQLRRYVTA